MNLDSSTPMLLAYLNILPVESELEIYPRTIEGSNRCR